jgi:tryptophan synthase beta chain
VGGGSSAAGIFAPLIDEPGVRLIGVKAAGEGIDKGLHAATLTAGRPGVLHGMETYVLQDDDGQTLPVHSVSAGLDYPGVGPEHAYWHETGMVTYTSADDQAALEAFSLLSATEGIIPALESAHAVAHAIKLAPTMPRDAALVINLSGRGDKDVAEVARIMESSSRRQ